MAVKRRLAMMPAALIRLNQFSEIQICIARHNSTGQSKTGRVSKSVWNIWLGKHQSLARDSYHAFIGSTTGRGRQRHGLVCYVGAYDGEIAAVEFPNVGATTEARRLSAARVRVRANPAEKCDRRIHLAASIDKSAEEGKNKIPAIAGVLLQGLCVTLANCGGTTFASQISGPGHSSSSKESENDPRTAWRTC